MLILSQIIPTILGGTFFGILLAFIPFLAMSEDSYSREAKFLFILSILLFLGGYVLAWFVVTGKLD